MKLILDKNYIQEVEKPTKEQEKGVKYHWYTFEWEQIELYDMEANKIAPIVRFLAEWKKGKISWLLISLAWWLLVVFFVLMLFLMWPSSETKTNPVNEVPLTPVNQTPVAQVVKTETETETEKETSWALQLANEVDMFKDQKTDAENEVLRLNYEIERLNITLKAKLEENKELLAENNSLKEELENLQTRKIESATDEFIYYLGDSVYKSCKQPTTEEKIENCKTLYFNFLEYGKR